MASNTEIMRANVSAIQLGTGGMELANVGQVFAFAELMEQAEWLPKGMKKEGAVIAIVAGQPLGLNAFQSVQGITPINGRPSIWGDAMVAVVKASGLLEDEQVEYLPSPKDCKGVRYTCKRRGIPTPYEGTFSIADAEAAGLWGKQGPWKQYPKRMLMNRARAFALRDAFPDALRGLRIAEEEQDVVDAEVITVQPPAPAKRKRATAAAIVGAVEASPIEMPIPTVEIEAAAVEAPKAAPAIEEDFL